MLQRKLSGAISIPGNAAVKQKASVTWPFALQIYKKDMMVIVVPGGCRNSLCFVYFVLQLI